MAKRGCVFHGVLVPAPTLLEARFLTAVRLKGKEPGLKSEREIWNRGKCPNISLRNPQAIWREDALLPRILISWAFPGFLFLSRGSYNDRDVGESGRGETLEPPRRQRDPHTTGVLPDEESPSGSSCSPPLWAYVPGVAAALPDHRAPLHTQRDPQGSTQSLM